MNSRSSFILLCSLQLAACSESGGGAVAPMSTASPSAAPTSASTPAPGSSPTPTLTPTATPTPKILTGFWQWSGSGPQQSGTLPNISLTNVSDGSVTIETPAIGARGSAGLIFENSDCPSSMISSSVVFIMNSPSSAAEFIFPVNRSTLSCSFTLDAGNYGYSVIVNYTNT